MDSDMDLEPSCLSDANCVTPDVKDFINRTLSFINTTGEIDEEVRAYIRLLRIIIPVIFGAICIFGVFGNLLVIIVILTDKQMRNTTNVLILSLAVADLLNQVFCLPFTATSYILPISPFGDIGCKAVTYLIFVCAYASMYTLVIMSLDRYLAVVHAIRSLTWRSQRNAWLAVTAIWIIFLCGNIPIFQQWGELNYIFNGEIRSTCLQISVFRDAYKATAFYISFVLIGYVIPLAIIMLLYGLMMKRLLYGMVPGGGNQSSGSIRTKKRVTRMVVIVIITFAFCYLPQQIIMILNRVIRMKSNISLASAGLAAQCISYMNSCLNPFLYAFLSGNFWRSFRRFLSCSDRF